MNTILNLDDFAKNIELTLGGNVYSIPPVTLKLKNDLISYLASLPEASDEEKKQADLNFLTMYLNTNLNNIVFTIEQLEPVLNTYQVGALINFIKEQVQGVEKN